MKQLTKLDKIQESSLKLDQSYFSLPNVILEVMKSIKPKADKRQVKLRAVILHKNHLDFFHLLFGNEQLYFEIITNFMNWSLDQTPDSGVV
jgi:signal transduction histidine kinase